MVAWDVPVLGFLQLRGAPSLLESTQPLCNFGCPHSLVNPILTLPLFYFSNEFSRMVAGEYLKFFVFTGMSLDQALRSELSMCTCVCGGHQSGVPTDRVLCSSATTQRAAGASRPHGCHLEILLPLE